MREGILEDIGVLASCLLCMNLDEPSLHREGPIKTLMKAAVYLLVYSTSQCNLKNKTNIGDNIPREY